jgi:glycosyltransferase involved in cell wall biosynthesis
MSQNSTEFVRKKANNRKKKYLFIRALFSKLISPWKPVVLYAPGNFQNPYQSLLYSGFKAYVTPVTLDKVLRYRKFGLGSVLHIHWDEVIIPKSDQRKADFAKQIIKQFHNSGGKIVWTIHNKFPHEIESEIEKERFLSNRAFMCKYADKIHVHNDYSRKYLIDNFDFDHNKVIVVAHPSYLEWYCIPEISKTYSRNKRFLLFGNMRGYKGFDLVTEALSKVKQADNIEEFHVAGHGADLLDNNQILSSKLAIKFTGGYINDQQVQMFYESADFAIFGFKAILTSGSVILAISFGVPPIAPAHPALLESLPEELHDLLYKPNDANDFARVIDYALSLDEKTYSKKVVACNLFSEKTKPSTISRKLEKLIFN